MYSRSTRTLTAEELSRLKSQSRVTADDIAWMLAPLGLLALAGLGIGKLLDWIASCTGLYSGALLTYPLLVFFGCLGLATNIFMIRGFIRSRSQLRAQVRANTAAVINVEKAKAVRIGDTEDEVPMVVYDLGDNKLLCLLGQWMYDPTVFESKGAAETFPSDSFSICVIPDSGRVLTVQVSGEFLGDLRQVTLKEVGLSNRKISEFRDCTVLDGTFDSTRDTSGSSI